LPYSILHKKDALLKALPLSLLRPLLSCLPLRLSTQVEAAGESKKGDRNGPIGQLFNRAINGYKEIHIYSPKEVVANEEG
jgi:hypothetical protein